MLHRNILYSESEPSRPFVARTWLQIVWEKRLWANDSRLGLAAISPDEKLSPLIGDGVEETSEPGVNLPMDGFHFSLGSLLAHDPALSRRPSPGSSKGNT